MSAVAHHEIVDRTVKMATTYLKKATDALFWYDRRPLLTGYWTLLEQALDTAGDIVGELPDDYFEVTETEDYFGLNEGRPMRYRMGDDALEKAEKLVAAIKARCERGDALRTILQLEDTTGRTEDEAKSYRAKAAELRRRYSL
jgi:hypothetical protein